jgi:allophanate hydrolase
MSKAIPQFTIGALTQKYLSGELTPHTIVEEVTNRIDSDDHNAWITIFDKNKLLDRADELSNLDNINLEEKPLYGVPYAVKDNIDVAEESTTAACPAYEYTPETSATVVDRIESAGAILIGKTNLDQFATGLVGTRSPYGTCRNAIDPEYISGGSSSGSAVAVADSQVAFTLGTDTGGSGRVPPSFNGIIGQKPTRGALSNNGVVPACRTLDCVSIFANTCKDALLVEQVAAGYDPADEYSRQAVDERSLEIKETTDSLTLGIPRQDQLEFFGDSDASKLFQKINQPVASVAEEAVTVDITSLLECSKLLFEGPWVAERLVPTRDVRNENSEALVPVLEEILQGAETRSAVDVFEAQYKRKKLKKEADAIFESIDALIVPTTGTIYTIDEINQKPIERNSNLGLYTNFVNLLDLAATTIPVGRRENGLPFGVTIIGEAFNDAMLAGIGDSLCRELNVNIGSTEYEYTELKDPIV